MFILNVLTSLFLVLCVNFSHVGQIYDQIEDQYYQEVYGDSVSTVENDTEIKFSINLENLNIVKNLFDFTVIEKSKFKYILQNQIFKPPIPNSLI